jgi:2,5-diamino-6-(ribosylamino)-4(3H)-pyrimidinone 5'-phosphate reductase
LIEESARGTPIVVEGKNDAKSLRGLGVEGMILMSKTCGKSYLDLISEIEETGSFEVILLLDFDRRGREWTERVRKTLERASIKVNTAFWGELQHFAGRELKDVEGLETYVETLREKIGKN